MYGLAMRRIFKAFSIELDTEEVAMPVLLKCPTRCIEIGSNRLIFKCLNISIWEDFRRDTWDETVEAHSQVNLRFYT